MDDARRQRRLRLAGLLIWLATLFNLGVAIAGDGVSKAQLVMVVCLTFASGMFAAWFVEPPSRRP